MGWCSVLHGAGEGIPPLVMAFAIDQVTRLVDSRAHGMDDPSQTQKRHERQTMEDGFPQNRHSLA